MSPLEALRRHDADLVELESGSGAVLLSPGLQGRIFCRLEDELIHRLDVALLANPSTEAFNNLGGNSLWPAPEGGPFAFNYPPDGDEWFVQEGIAKANPEVTCQNATGATMEKTIALVNRNGIDIQVTARRAVSVADLPGQALALGLQGVAYDSEDTFIPCGRYQMDDVLLAPWSLEQFPGCEGVVVFGKVECPQEAINFDFYGDPRDRISYAEGLFIFTLGGEDRHQIGVRVASAPESIGALDYNRSLLMLRTTAKQEGTYFNIADNDQPDGPFSAADLYSVFNGGELGFFELETIGAMQSDGGILAPSSLTSRTVILRGEGELLRRYLDAAVGF